MRSFSVKLSRGLGVLLAFAAATMAWGQQITVSQYALPKAPPARKAADEPASKGAIHRIEMLSGPNRSVRYMFSGDVPSHEREAAMDMQRSENELMYIQDLERLKQQYVNGERVMEPQRRDVQRQLYGRSITTERDLSNYNRGGYNGYGGYGLYGGGFGLYGGGLGLYGGGLGLYGGGLGMGYWPSGFGGYGGRPGFTSGSSGDSGQTVNQSLQNGVGDEGRFKDAMVQAIAKQTTPEYATETLHHYEKSLARAGSSPMLAKAISLSRTATASAEYEPSYAPDSKVTLWIGSDKYTGTVKEDRPGWIVLETDKGEVGVRKSQIMRSEVLARPARGASRETVSKRD
jgi:hypothetical protein